MDGRIKKVHKQEWCRDNRQDASQFVACIQGPICIQHITSFHSIKNTYNQLAILHYIPYTMFVETLLLENVVQGCILSIIPTLFILPSLLIVCIFIIKVLFILFHLHPPPSSYIQVDNLTVLYWLIKTTTKHPLLLPYLCLSFNY